MRAFTDAEKAAAAWVAKPVRQRRGPPKDAPWCWLSIDMLEAPAWRAMSAAARRVVDRILIEHMHHGARENGRLIVTKTQFGEFGIRESSVAAAIREAEALGWISTTYQGKGGNTEFRRASHYALGWLPLWDGEFPKHRWRRFTSVRDAKLAVRQSKAARSEPRRARAA